MHIPKSNSGDRLPHPTALWPVFFLFGSLYFIQGIIEPTACLPGQGLQTQLRAWGFSPLRVGHFFGIIGIAWSLKPLFGLISDFLPIGGSRRWSYLVLSTLGTGLAYWLLAACWGRQSLQAAEWLLIGVSLGIAFSDVVMDALAVEVGQPRGITGQIQSVQWGTNSVAAIVSGSLGGYIAQHGLLSPTFIGCGVLGMVSLAVVLLVVREPPQAAPSHNLRAAWAELSAGRRWAMLLAAGAFLFLWNFNPFSSNVLQHYMTDVLSVGEQFYGHTASIMAAAQVVACVAYWFYCRRVPFMWLVHGSIVAGILSSLCYWGMHDRTSAVLASIVFGFSYQTAALVLYDLAARVCPTESAGTTFALLMALGNTGVSLGTYLGGGWYDALTAAAGGNRQLAFDALVGIGGLFTAACWLLVPLIKLRPVAEVARHRD